MFNDLYTAVYAILDDAKTDRNLIKLYKGSHLSSDPHESVLAFGEFFAKQRRGLLGFASTRVNPCGPARVADLDVFDAEFRPRVPIRAVFDVLAATMRRPDESLEDLLTYLATRIHILGAYRGQSSGFDEETRAVASLHFRQLGISSRPDQVLVSCGGAKGIFLAVCAALMCRRRFDELDRHGGTILAPEGYYQSLRLIPAIFGGDIHVVPDLSGPALVNWLARTAVCPGRAVYVPLVNNATGQVLTADRAHDLGSAILEHNTDNRGNPVFVIGDDVYAGTYLDLDPLPKPIGAVRGLSEWTVSVVSPSKTFAFPTSRVAFATTAHSGLATALRHYRTVFSHGRVPQTTELSAAAALALTPQEWIDNWNHRYRDRFNTLAANLELINTEVGADVVSLRAPHGGWYAQLRIARDLFPTPIASHIDAFAALLHYGGNRPDSGLGLLPGELFGHRLHPTDTHAALRATLAVDDRQLTAFTTRLREAIMVLRGPDGTAISTQAVRRARAVADLDTILANIHY